MFELKFSPRLTLHIRAHLNLLSRRQCQLDTRFDNHILTKNYLLGLIRRIAVNNHVVEMQKIVQ